jgi:hypothetical protein
VTGAIGNVCIGVIIAELGKIFAIGRLVENDVYSLVSSF